MLFNSLENRLFSVCYDCKGYPVRNVDGIQVIDAKLFRQHRLSDDCFTINGKIYRIQSRSDDDRINLYSELIVDDTGNEIVDIIYAKLEFSNKRFTIVLTSGGKLMYASAEQQMIILDDGCLKLTASDGGCIIPLVCSDFQGIADDVTTFDISLDGVLNYTTTKGNVKYYNLNHRAEEPKSWTIPCPTFAISSVATNNGGATAIIDDDGKLWMTSLDNQSFEIVGIPDGTHAQIAVVDELHNLAILLSDGSVYIIDMRSESQTRSFPPRGRREPQRIVRDVSIVDLSFNMGFLRVCTADNELLLYQYIDDGIYVYNIECLKKTPPKIISNTVKSISPHSLKIARESCTKRALSS